MKIRDVDIIWLSSERVKNTYSSTSISLAKELSKTNRVIFINNPYTHFMLLKKLFGKGKSLYRREYSWMESDSNSFFVRTPTYVFSINWLCYGYLYRALLKFNNKLTFSFINRLLAEYKINDYIFVNVFNPYYFKVEYLKRSPLLSVYYSVDEIGLSPYLSKHGSVLEGTIHENYDLVLSTSSELYKKFSIRTKRSRYLPNGADTSLFKKKPEYIPSELGGVEQPIVIYTGHIDWRMDVKLIEEVIQGCQDLMFLFVGPVSLPLPIFERLKSYSNVSFVGSKHISDLPAFLHNSSCAIIPFKINELTKSIYPLKINEYLATGIPVVSTSFSSDINDFSDVIALADTSKLFEESIRASIVDKRVDKRNLRVQRADINQWSERAKAFWGFVSEPCKRNENQE